MREEGEKRVMNLTDRVNRVLNNPYVTELVKGTIRLALAEGLKAHAMSMVVRIERIERIEKRGAKLPKSLPNHVH